MRRGHLVFLYPCHRLYLCIVRNSIGMITVTAGLSGKYFSATVPDVELAVTGSKAEVALTVAGEEVFKETLYPVGGVISIVDLRGLVTPYARRRLIATLTLDIREQDADEGTLGTQQLSADIIYCEADFSAGTVPVDAADFCRTHFLTLLQGPKISSEGRLEFLHYLGADPAQVTAEYADGSTKQFEAVKVQGNDRYTTVDVSPHRFTTDGKRLIAFEVTAGERRQRFELDLSCPSCAPVLLFSNSFGCDELVYCTGKHQVAPSYKRNSAYFGGELKNYDIEETRAYKADTGYLTIHEAYWLDDLFRSSMVRLVTFSGQEPRVGKEVVVTESKSEFSNLDEEMPRFTFTYQLAQKNHNVINVERAGRIFEDAFDTTFN